MEGFQKEKYEPAKKDYEETTKMREMQDQIKELNRANFWAVLHESQAAVRHIFRAFFWPASLPAWLA